MTQADQILAALKDAGQIGLTGVQIYNACGSMRYSARIEELRKDGHKIETRRDGTSASGAAIFRYVLEPTPEPDPVPEPPENFSGQLFETRRETAHYREVA